MLMVVGLHAMGQSTALTAYAVMSPAYMGAWTVEITLYIAVNCFVLISGYFLSASTFKLRKVLALEAQIIFYCFFIYLGLVMLGKTPFTVGEVAVSLLPTLTGQYWFVSAYMGMYLLSPFINVFINAATRQQHRNLVILLVALFSIWPVVFFFGTPFSLQSYIVHTGYSVVWFVVLYLIGAYIKRYYTPTQRPGRYFAQWALASLAAAATLFAAVILTKRTDILQFEFLQYLLKSYSAITVLIPSILFFLAFVNLKIDRPLFARPITFLAPLAFGVYLIHEEPHVRALLWQKINLPAAVYEPYFAPLMIGTVLAIFFAAIFIDFIRHRLFNAIGTSPFFSVLRQGRYTKALFSDDER
jgi:surface polysaccharide O-acyltransferase-like enzyme